MSPRELGATYADHDSDHSDGSAMSRKSTCQQFRPSSEGKICGLRLVVRIAIIGTNPGHVRSFKECFLAGPKPATAALITPPCPLLSRNSDRLLCDAAIDRFVPIGTVLRCSKRSIVGLLNPVAGKSFGNLRVKCLGCGDVGIAAGSIAPFELRQAASVER
jgi:hypothetical protein